MFFEFPVSSCTKPGFKTEVYKMSPGGATSHPIVRPNQATTYEFTPIKIEVVDTYDHDIASTLTAYLYAHGHLGTTLEGSATAAANTAVFLQPGKLIPFSNAPGGSEFHIIEFLEHMPYDHSFVNAVRQGGQELPPGAQSVLMRAGKWTLYKPYLASVDFDSYNHAGTEKLSTVTVEVVYDKYDYDYVYHRFYGDPVLPAVLAGQPRRGLGSGDSMSTSMGAQGSPLPGAGRGGIAGEAGDLPLPPGIPTPE